MLIFLKYELLWRRNTDWMLQGESIQTSLLSIQVDKYKSCNIEKSAENSKGIFKLFYVTAYWCVFIHIEVERERERYHHGKLQTWQLFSQKIFTGSEEKNLKELKWELGLILLNFLHWQTNFILEKD